MRSTIEAGVLDDVGTVFLGGIGHIHTLTTVAGDNAIGIATFFLEAPLLAITAPVVPGLDVGAGIGDTTGYIHSLVGLDPNDVLENPLRMMRCLPAPPKIT